MTVLYPDRFAAGVPVSPPVTQGAWTGLDFDGCDEFEFKDGNDSYTPCYINANGSRPRDQHTRKLLENLRHVPLAIFAGAQDELVPYSGVFRQHERLVQLGYQHRLYTNFVAEHYTPPAMDQWEAVAAYEHQFVRRENPARVTYIRDMPFERATEEVQATGLGLNFDFDSAYWMSHLTPVNLTTGQASFDGSSLAIPSEPHQAIPDTDAPTAVGEAGPYVVTGLRWVDDPTTSAPALQNRFTATLKGASAVRVDLARMSIDPGQIVTAAVATDSALDLQVDGGWFVAPTATVDGSPATVTFADGVVHIMVPPSAAAQNIVITPSSGGDAIPA